MWGSVVILRSQKGVGEQKRLGSTVVCNLPVPHTYKHCSKPQRRTHWYILRMYEQHERPLYAASGGCTSSPNTRTYLPHCVTLQKAAFIWHVQPPRSHATRRACHLNPSTCWLLQHQHCVKDVPTKAQWSIYVPHSGHYMYRQFNIQQICVPPTHCIYVFCVDLRTNSHYFPIQH